MGRPLPQTEMKIIDPDTGATMQRGDIGEICARGYGVMMDYFDNAEATSLAIDGEGWLIPVISEVSMSTAIAECGPPQGHDHPWR